MRNDHRLPFEQRPPAHLVGGEPAGAEDEVGALECETNARSEWLPHLVAVAPDGDPRSRDATRYNRHRREVGVGRHDDEPAAPPMCRPQRRCREPHPFADRDGAALGRASTMVEDPRWQIRSASP